MVTESIRLVGGEAPISPLMGLPLDSMTAHDFQTLEDIFVQTIKQNPGQPLVKMDDVKRMFIEGQDSGNHFLNAVRASRKFVESIRGTTFTSTEFFNILKLAGVLGVISDSIETKDEIVAAFESKNNIDRIAHAAGAAGNAFSAFGNLWQFMSGVNYLRPLDSHFVKFMDKAGPVSWGLSAVMLIHVAWRFHTVDKMSDRLEQAGKEGALAPLRFYQVLLRDGDKSIKTPNLMFSMQLMHRVPMFESKYHIKQKIKTVARNYFMTGDKTHTDKLADMTQKQIKVAKIFLGIKATALICGMVAGAFFYFPALKDKMQIGWALLAGGATLCVANIAYGKYKTVMFMKELNKLAEESEEDSEKAMNAYIEFLDAIIKASENPEFFNSTIIQEQIAAESIRISDKVA